MSSIHLQLAAVLSSTLAVLACAPARLGSEIAGFQRKLDVELAAALEPRASPGLEAACHRAPIVWMHFVADGPRWRLMSVDESGEVGIWTERGLEQTWSLHEEELAGVREVEARQSLSEDATWLRDRARVPRPFRASSSEFPFVLQYGGPPEEVAPRDDDRWIGVYQRSGPDRLRSRRSLAASGNWYAVGDEEGNLAVARVAAQREASIWLAPACEDLRAASIGAAGLELVTDDRIIDLSRGEQSPPRFETQRRQKLRRLIFAHDWLPYEPDDSTRLALAEMLTEEPGVAWQPIRATLSVDERWLAVADEAGWWVRDRISDETRRIEASSQVAFAAVSSRGTLARSGGEVLARSVELHPSGEEAITHLLPAAPVGLAFVPNATDGEDTLFIGVAHEWESFNPLDLQLLRLEPGGVPEPHSVAGFDQIERVLGHIPVPTPTLVVAGGGGVLGIERLTDGAVLRVVLHELSSTHDASAGVSLIWLDSDGRRRCRCDGAGDDFASSRVARIDEAGDLVDAFLSGRDCPSH